MKDVYKIILMSVLSLAVAFALSACTDNGQGKTETGNETTVDSIGEVSTPEENEDVSEPTQKDETTVDSDTSGTDDEPAEETTSGEGNSDTNDVPAEETTSGEEFFDTDDVPAEETTSDEGNSDAEEEMSGTDMSDHETTTEKKGGEVELPKVEF